MNFICPLFLIILTCIDSMGITRTLNLWERLKAQLFSVEYIIINNFIEFKLLVLWIISLLNPPSYTYH